jgi:transposase
MSKVDLFAAIRRDSRAGLSVRALARKYQVSRRTVRSALSSAWPAPRKPMPPRPSKLDAFKPVIDDILRADLDAPSKQRHTGESGRLATADDYRLDTYVRFLAAVVDHLGLPRVYLLGHSHRWLRRPEIRTRVPRPGRRPDPV